MVNSKFKIKKLLNLILEVFTYTFVILLINICFGNVSLKQIAQSILPITYHHYWFITTYVMLYILSPFINKFIECINKKDFGVLIIILLTIQSIMKTFLVARFQYSELLWVVTLYFIGAYISKYYIPNKNSIKIDIIFVVGSYLTILLTILSLDVISTKINFVKGHELFFSQMTSIFVVVNSIFLFLLFRNIKIGENKFINKISGATLGVYIIHENTFLRYFIWRDIVNAKAYVNSNYLIVNAIIAIIGVFTICTIIELLRQIIIGPLQDRFVNYTLEKSKKIKNKLFNRYILNKEEQK